MSTTQNVTLLLDQAASGNRIAADELFGVVYDELRRLAQVQLHGEACNHTLQSTALVHEVWLKLIGNQSKSSWNNRNHFFAAAAQAMRRILVDSARARKRIKRGGDKKRMELREGDLIFQRDDELLALEEALELLRKEDEQKVNLVCLRYFGGFTNAEAAEQLGISTATAERYWAYARAWLRKCIEDSEE